MGLLRMPRNGCNASARVLTTRDLGAWLLRFAAAGALTLLMFAGTIFSNAHEASAGEAATIANDGVALFAGIDDQTVIATMYAGERVDVLWGPQAGLYEVRYFGIDGWTWAENLILDGGGATAASTGGNGGGGGSNAVVNTDALSVRDGADFDSGIYEYYGAGTSVTVVGDAVNGFVPILYGDGTAWIYAGYLSWDGTVTAGVGGMTSPLPDTSSSQSAGSGEHWIDVNRSNGLVTLYIGDEVQAQYWGSLSYDSSDGGFYTTASGTYYVYHMYEDLAYTPYAKAYIEDWVGFDPARDNGFHSWTMDSKGNVLPNGSGFTGGCVGLEPSAAQAVYDFAYMGMRVEVHN